MSSATDAPAIRQASNMRTHFRERFIYISLPWTRHIDIPIIYASRHFRAFYFRPRRSRVISKSDHQVEIFTRVPRGNDIRFNSRDEKYTTRVFVDWESFFLVRQF